MQGQLSLFEMIPRPCECGSTNIEVQRVECGSHSGKFLYWCECKDCKMYGCKSDGWVSNAKDRLQAIKDWNENKRKESVWKRLERKRG